MEVCTGQLVHFSTDTEVRMFPNVFLRYLNLGLPSPESERPTDSTTRHASLGYQMWLGVLARLETRHTHQTGSWAIVKPPTVDSRGFMPWLVMRRKHTVLYPHRTHGSCGV